MTTTLPTESALPARNDWHTLAASDAALALNVDPTTGLDHTAASNRLNEAGPNRLADAPRSPRWKVFLNQLRGFLTIVLLVAAVVSAVVAQELKTPIIIMIVVLINAVLGTMQEGKAEKSLEALRSMLVTSTRVRRSGELHDINAESLVPGDIVLLEAGDRVPADGLVLSSTGLEVEEAALTGEATPSSKAASDGVAIDAPLGDRGNSLFLQTSVTRGRAEMLVTQTGMHTQIGHLAGLLRETVVDATPLQKQLDKLAHVLAGLAGVLVVIVVAIGLVRGNPLDEVFLTAVALAVASIPEGLPAVVAVTLAVGTFQMAKQQAVVKRLASVETLGCTTVICSDKTGTLTLNQMTATQLWIAGSSIGVSGDGYNATGELAIPTELEDLDLTPVLQAAVLCSDAVMRDGVLIGDPTEGALIALAAKAGVDAVETRSKLPRVAEVPFDSAHKFMATLHAQDGLTMYVKGAPDVVLNRVTTAIDASNNLVPLDRELVLEANQALASKGLRVLALARRSVHSGEMSEQELFDTVTDLTLLALVGIVDPPRPEAIVAVADCHTAGIDVKMITGDHPSTAAAIGNELGLHGRAVTGNDLQHMTDQELTDQVEEITVFARVSPEHKLRIIRALRSRGHVVAMTGDGVNDAPALKQADIGIAMGITGTEVTKEAATMVLTDDNFATIVRAVRQGRAIYDNIVTFVRFQLTTTIGFATTFLAASIGGIAGGSPFQAIQILWVNIIMDGPPAMALGVDPPTGDVLERKPRSPSERILSLGRTLSIVWVAAAMAAITLTVMVTAPDYSSDLDSVHGTVAGTMAFTTFVFLQLFNALNVRGGNRSVFSAHTLSNKTLWLSMGAAALLQVLSVELSVLHGIFDTTHLTLEQWAICLGSAALIVVIEEIRQAGQRWRLRPASVGEPRQASLPSSEGVLAS